MRISKDHITEYIPHRSPFVMIDNLLAASKETLESNFYISEDNVMVEGGFFQEGGLMENIAQTCAVGFGIEDVVENQFPRMGFIGAITKMQVYALPPVGTQITTLVMLITQLGNISLVKGINYLGDQKLLECEMKIVVN
jgi:3-hydroxyacyl-[acyl-carrier-protein] dehydratase